MSVLPTGANKIGSKQMIENQKVLLSMHVLQNRADEKNHISVNTSEVKDANNETKDEEPLVTDNSVINVPIYF